MLGRIEGITNIMNIIKKKKKLSDETFENTFDV